MLKEKTFQRLELKDRFLIYHNGSEIYRKTGSQIGVQAGSFVSSQSDQDVLVRGFGHA